MPILENATDYAADDQVTPANLNALTESSKFVKDGAGVTNTGNTTDEASCNINANGEIEVNSGGVTTAKLGDESVTTAKLVDAAITAAKIDTDAVTADAIAADAVGSSEIATDAVTATEIAAGAVGTDEVAANAITEAKLATAVSNYLPRAFGTFNWDTGAETYYGEGVDSVSHPDGVTRRINLTNAFSTTSYTVIHSLEDDVGASVSPLWVRIIDADTFEIKDSVGENAGKKVHFVCFGTLA